MYGLADTPIGFDPSAIQGWLGPASPIGSFALWVRQQFQGPPTYVPPAAPTGSVLTTPPASGEQAQATVDTLLNQQMAAQQQLAGSQVKSGFLDYLSSDIVDTGNAIASTNWSWLLWGGLAVGLVVLVSVSGGGRRR